MAALGRRDRSRLAEALEGLPAEVAFLRESILDIARQDQDLLGCGEADTSHLVAAVRGFEKTGSEVDSVGLADVLREWLEGIPEHGAAWAGPAWFVEGFLRGCGEFGADYDDMALPRPALGLQRIELNIPAGMKVKLWAGGLELRERGVQIIIVECDDESFEARSQVMSDPHVPNWPSRLGTEHNPEFVIGAARGQKRTWRDVDSGLTVMAEYLLEMPGAKVWISIFSKRKLGDDLGKYEAILATIRRKEGRGGRP